jgi:hypothetical protein
MLSSSGQGRSILVVLLALGCGAGTPASSPPGNDSGSADADAPAPEVSPKDVAPRCALDQGYFFETSHGFNPRSEKGTLSPPTAFTYERKDVVGNTASCNVVIAGCGPSYRTISDIMTDLNHPDVVAALTAQAPLAYGDKNTADGDSFSFGSSGGGGFSIVLQAQCSTTTADCLATPAGVRILVTDLNALVDGALATPACAALR